jgi:hypothetical protein
VVGSSTEVVLSILAVVRERDEIEEIEEEGVWVLMKGGGVVENVSCLRSGSNGELDGEGEGEWV